MLGSEQIVIDGAEFVKGQSSSESLSDGGFSPETEAVNLIAEAGAIYGPASPTDKSTNLTGQMIASCEDPSDNYHRLFVSGETSTNDGRFFYCNSAGDLTEIGAEDTGQDYIQGKTDMAAYKGEVYISSNGNCRRLNSIGSGNTFDAGGSWPFAYNNSSAPHPLLVFEDSLYHADGNLLKRQTDVGDSVAPSTILTLPTGSVIVALGIDPSTGKMLISYVGQMSNSGTKATISKVGFYDGFSNKLNRTVIVEEMITAFPNCNGIQYVSYGQSLGYWNGSGASFLARFSDIGFSFDELLYKHHFATSGNTLYFVVDTRIMAHGPVRKMGDRIFYPAFKNSANLTHICSIGQNTLAFSYTTSTFKTWSTTSVSSNAAGAFVTNPLRFPRPIQIRGLVLEYVSLATATTPCTITYRNGSSLSNQFLDFTSGTNQLLNGSAFTIMETQIPTIGMLNDKGSVFTFKLTRGESNVNIGIRRIIIRYDWVE